MFLTFPIQQVEGLAYRSIEGINPHQSSMKSVDSTSTSAGQFANPVIIVIVMIAVILIRIARAVIISS